MSTLDETIKAYVTKMANDPTSVWTTTPPKETPKNLLELVRAAKNKLVQSQRYDDAKDLRDIERLLMEKLGNEPVVLNDIEAILDDVREAKNASARAEEGVSLIEQRIEKMEKALSEEMAKVREMDDILAGVVKRVGYVSDEPSEVLVCAPGDSIADPMAELIKWLDAEIATTKENIDLIKQHNGGLKPLIQFEAILATYRAVKAHITG